MATYQEFVANLRQAIRLSDVVRSHLKLNRRGKEFVGLCPFHHEKGASFTINDDKGFYHCFGCGAHGDLFDFVMQKLHLSFKEAVELIAQQAGLVLPKFEQDNKGSNFATTSSHDQFYKINEIALRWFEDQLQTSSSQEVLAYLKRRGLNKTTVLHFRLGYAPESGLKQFMVSQGFSEALLAEAGLLIQPEERREPYDRFRRRLMFPIQDVKGRVIGFGGRIIDQGEPKYLNSPDTPLFHKGRNLYALHHAIPEVRIQKQPLIVVEGYMDVIALYQRGIKSAVAPLGTALSGEQIRLLWRYHAVPILWFDGDEAGKRAAERAALRCLEVLKPGYSLQFAFLPTGDDPDSLVRFKGVDIARQHLTQTITLVEMLWRIFNQGRSFQTPEEKAKARQDLIELTQGIKDPDTRHFYRQELNQRLQKILMNGHHHQKTGGRIAQINPADRPILGNSQKKIQGQKILLATLINHPTLISEVIEQLMILDAASDSISQLRQALVSLHMELPELGREELVNRLQEDGFSEIISEFEQNSWQAHVKFVSSTASDDEALQGWCEIWQRVHEHQSLQEEVVQAMATMTASFDEESWQRLKLIKQSLMATKNLKEFT